MGYLKRAFVFLLVNILIISTIGILVYLTGLDKYLFAYGVGYQGLLITSFIWGMGGAFISLLLSRFMVKMMMSVRVIDPGTATGDTRDLVQMVYALASKAGLKKMPEVGIYESDEVNAFATGPTKNRALVAVSTGLLYRMNRNQIEGVLGHEVAHIANGDMVTMTLVQGVVNSFVLFASQIITRILSQATRDENGRGGLSGFAYYMVYQLVYSVLSLLAFPIVAWVSRYREFRADSGGARLAGTDKMISALQALKGTKDLIDDESAAVATLKISGSNKGLAQLFATHPHLDERIKRLQMGRL